MAPSALPETQRWPSGVKATEVTLPACPRAGWKRTSAWALSSQCRATLARPQLLAGELARATGGSLVEPGHAIRHANLDGWSQFLLSDLPGEYPGFAERLVAIVGAVDSDPASERLRSTLLSGTPEQLVLNPATDYGEAFTQGIPRAKVLSAGAIMRAVDGDSFSGTVQANVAI